MKRVLIVDDEQSILTLLEYNLENVGFYVETAMDGEEAFNKVQQNSYDMILLDIMLPKMSGMDVCRRAREKGIITPIVMLTARADEYDKIIGLELGADDYITKPFSPNEVIARIKAILRRVSSQQYRQDDDPTPANPANPVKIVPNAIEQASLDHTRKNFGEIQIFTERFEVRVRGGLIDITPKEYELLVYMAERKGRTLSREQLLTQVWQFDYLGETRIVDVHISNLRQKIERNNKNPQYIITVRGFGYRFEVPEDER